MRLPKKISIKYIMAYILAFLTIIYKKKVGEDNEGK